MTLPGEWPQTGSGTTGGDHDVKAGYFAVLKGVGAESGISRWRRRIIRREEVELGDISGVRV